MTLSLKVLMAEITKAKAEGLQLALRIDNEGVEHWHVIDKDKRFLGMEASSRMQAWESYLFGKKGE